MSTTRRRFLQACTSGLALGAGAASAQRPAQRPNLLFIMTDQQPPSTLRCYGNSVIQTPHLDRLAAGGMRFDNCHIAGFPCSPSRATMLSGLYPHGHGVVRNDVVFSEDVASLGQILKAAGYDTGYIGKWHLGGSMYRGIKGRKPHDGNWFYRRVPSDEEFRFEQVEGGSGEDDPQHGFVDKWVGGWKHYRAYLRQAGLGDLVDANPGLGNHNDLPSAREGQHMHSRLPEEHHMAAFFAQEAAGFIRERRDSESPFGLVLSFYGPHLPVAPPKPWDEMYSLEQAELPLNHRDTLHGKPLGQRRNTRIYRLGEWTDEQFRDYTRRYWGYCSYIDAQIGGVLQALDDSGLADDTIVVFTSDHGDMIAGHGMIFKLGSCAYDELMRVPLLVRVPGVTAPASTSDALVSNVDFLPTLLSLMDVPCPDGVHGEDFADVLSGRRRKLRDAVFCDSSSNSIMVRTQQWKYVLHWRNRDIDELYNMENDPGELRNLAQEPKHKAAVRRLQRRALDWLSETQHPYAHIIADAAKQPAEIKLIDARPEVRELKYLGGSEFEMTYVWHVDGPVPGADKNWSFTQFHNARYGAAGTIAFKFTEWPDPPTTAWRKGDEHTIGPVRVRVPDHCGTGKYEVRIGLWNPDTRKPPGILADGVGNYKVVGQFEIQKKADAITNIRFVPE
ncbi:MAG: sulfatase-like hydrolase/transferase [Armatimonadota bacterium]